METIHRLKRQLWGMVGDDSGEDDTQEGSPREEDRTGREGQGGSVVDSELATYATERAYRHPDYYDFEPSAIESRIDIIRETGLPPEQFVTRLLQAENGRFPQQALTEFTDLSPASISRLLQDLEDESVVVRLQVGRRKVVCLPEAVPTPMQVDDGNEGSD